MVGRIRFALERFASPRHRSHVAQLFSLGHERLLGFVVSQIGRRRFSAVRFLVSLAADILDGARLALICRRRASAAASGERQRFLSDVFMKIHETWPNKSLEPTPITPSVCREVTRWRKSPAAWLSFFR